MQNPSSKYQPGKLVQAVGLAIALSSLVFSAPASAQADQKTIEELKAQISALASRLEQLETSNKQLEASNKQTATAVAESQKADKATSWAENIKLSGDLRTRFENIDDDSKLESRDRTRIRARLGIAAKVNDDWKVGFQLASGDGDPISTNQTLGNGSSGKGFNIDMAYFEWTGIKNLLVTGGRTKNQFFRPGSQSLIFDGDYRPEGFIAKYEDDSLFATAGTMFLESDNKAGTQAVASMKGLQFGYKAKLNDVGLTVGGSYYDAGVAGKKPFYNNLVLGNTMDAKGAYVNDYREAELFAEAKFTMAGKSMSVFGDYVKNLDASTHNKGWAVGTKFGGVTGPGTWEVGYVYQNLQADAVYGGWTDSDFGGGGTDTKGSVFDFAYGIGRNTQVGVNYYMDQYGMDHGKAIDYNRFHIYVVNSF